MAILYWGLLAGALCVAGRVLALIVAQGWSTPAAATLAGLVALLATLTTASRWRFEARARLVIGLASVAATLGGVEVLLAVVDPLAPPARSVPAAPAVSKGEVVRALWARGIVAYPTTYPNLFYDKGLAGRDSAPLAPIGTVSRVVSVFCNETGDHLVYTTDRFGFRNADSIWDGTIDVAVVGDSFVHGACVPDDDDMVSRLGGRLQRNVLNLGAAGGGPLVALAALREYLRDRNVSWIVWAFFAGNDLEDLGREWKSPTYARYLMPGFLQDLTSRQPDIDRGLVAYLADANGRGDVGDENAPSRGGGTTSIARIASAAVDTMLLRRTRHLLDWIADGDWFALSMIAYQRLDIVHGMIADEARARGARLAVLYLHPAEAVLTRRYRSPEFARVRAIAERRGIPFVDVIDEFSAVDDPRSLLGGGHGPHYSAWGYALVAEKLASTLARLETPARPTPGGGR